MRSGRMLVLSTGVLLAAASATAYRGQMGMSAKVSDHTAKPVVAANGDLRVPTDYRTAYQFLGSWSVAADNEEAGAKSLHVVYASPGAIAAYRKDGRFPDGAVLVKEVFRTDTQPMTTGTVSRAQKLMGWFVMVKESRNPHPDNNLWGDGWAWSWFDAANPDKTTSTNYKVQCLTCHEPARSHDLVYVQGYPPLMGGQ